jgi:hypothetical protein
MRTEAPLRRVTSLPGPRTLSSWVVRRGGTLREDLPRRTRKTVAADAQLAGERLLWRLGGTYVRPLASRRKITSRNRRRATILAGQRRRWPMPLPGPSGDLKAATAPGRATNACRGGFSSQPTPPVYSRDAQTRTMDDQRVRAVRVDQTWGAIAGRRDDQRQHRDRQSPAHRRRDVETAGRRPPLRVANS